MFRLHDWACSSCASTQEVVTQFPSGVPVVRMRGLWCEICADVTLHERQIPLLARYMGETTLNPQVSGGRFDTMGMKDLPDLPDLPRGVESTTDNYKQLFATSDWREAAKHQDAIKKENKAKKKRAVAMARGEVVNMRRDKLPGDPRVSA